MLPASSRMEHQDSHLSGYSAYSGQQTYGASVTAGVGPLEGLGVGELDGPDVGDDDGLVGEMVGLAVGGINVEDG